MVKLKGFVFFASVHHLIALLEQRMTVEAESDRPEHRRLKFVIFYCELLDGMDVSAAKAIKKLVSEAASSNTAFFSAA